ncbi:hypothetical protein ADICYQ_1923 [Cyclobacterium qasimii M12-11B]|uniref:Uncharacterized protein n=1 Tax=Cyclobacterium qasimii M12-11B TaxID=641524 RepID=S7WYM7_9BACT|nr:hypothetical protein ADICYQ_1923 [Cyclobacterium qasimii M12-11B]
MKNKTFTINYHVVVILIAIRAHFLNWAQTFLTPTPFIN